MASSFELSNFVSLESTALPEDILESAWLEHGPFAMFLAERLRPRTFVELGSHRGFSFFCMCQSVRDNRIGTACYAVDTWKGDEHAGFYENDVFENVSRINEKYSSFSSLMRMTFGEALAYFPDKSIDLLHIDGRHFYEDAKEDFETWRPKLTDDAIVLFHDTNVRERNFGVWRLFDELKAHHKTFEFKHGYGLGILSIDRTPPALAALFEADEHQTDLIRATYARLGSHVSRLSAQMRAVQSARSEIQQAQADTQHSRNELHQAEVREAENLRVIGENARTIADLTARLRAIETSTTWRATHPARALGGRFPAAARSLRRFAKATWWTLTFQLGQRYRLWRDHRDEIARLPVVTSAIGTPRGPDSGLRPRDIRIEPSAEPVVSIIIATYGKANFTLACLKSIEEHRPRCGFEIILVDDAFPQGPDVDLLNQVKGIELIRNETNQGFLLSCNLAAARAKGRYLLMLNNDTEVRQGSIDALVDLLERRPDAGIAGSKMLFADGVLQEAGGIVWSDASGSHVGRGDDPAKPQYNYVREVDYCSGASILIRRDLFETLGGFDEIFVPAYYEDTDLAFRTRKMGLKVLFEPRSSVFHHEGVSHGTDLQQGVKGHQIVNQSRMAARWRETLTQDHFPREQSWLRARDRAKHRKIILIIDHAIPRSDRDAGSRSTLSIIDSLIDAGWIVKFWPQTHRRYDPVYTPQLEARGVEVIDSRDPIPLEDWLSGVAPDLDHVLVNRPDIAEEVLPALHGRGRFVRSFYGHDLHSARLARQARLDEKHNAQLLQKAEQWEGIERRVWRNYDLVLYPSESEVTHVRETAPGTLARSILLYSPAISEARKVAPANREILFVAGFGHPPNVDAAQFLVHQILPELQHRIGNVAVTLAGTDPTPAVKALAGSNVRVTGYVTDEALDALYRSHRVALVPLRFGAGVKGKVVEALALGLPLVTTSIGAQGIPHLKDIAPVFDEVNDIVASVAELLTNDVAWLAQSHAQTRFAEKVYSKQAVRNSILSSLEAAEDVRAARARRAA